MPLDPELKWSTTYLLTDVKCPVDSNLMGMSVKWPTLRPVAGVKGYMLPAAVESILWPDLCWDIAWWVVVVFYVKFSVLWRPSFGLQKSKPWAVFLFSPATPMALGQFVIWTIPPFFLLIQFLTCFWYSVGQWHWCTSSGYYSWACRQSIFCLRLHANEAYE